jgi:hypothetical protein
VSSPSMIRSPGRRVMMSTVSSSLEPEGCERGSFESGQ